MKRTVALVCALIMALTVLPAMAFAAPAETRVEHADVNFFMTDLDYTSVTSVEDGGTGLHATSSKRYTYLGISENSGMYSCQYLINYPDEFVTITNQSNSWSGGLIAQTLAQIDNEEQTSDNFDSVCNLTYEGQTGGKPVGEAGEIYINGGVYLKTFDFGGVQLGGNFHRFTVRLDKTPFQSECEQDANGYYLPIALEMLEFTYGIYNDSGVLQASINYCKPENIGEAPWLSWTDGKLYVNAKEDPTPATPEPTEEPTPEPTEEPIPGDHNDVNFFMTDMDYTSVTAVDQGGTGLHATTSQRYTYLGITENSGMYSCQYLINYPDEFVTITNQSNSWSGGLIAQTLAQIDNEEQTSDNFDSVCNLTYEGQTGGKPVGEEGEIYINGGVYLKTFDFGGVQLGGNFHRFTVRLDKAPTEAECEQDENGYYLPIGLEMLEFTYGIYNDAGVLQASINWCKPENIENAPWLSWTSGKIYVTPLQEVVTPEPTEEPTPAPTAVPTYTVYFYVDGEEYTHIDYAYGETYEMPVYTPATGYEFSGWTQGDDGNWYGTTTAINYTVTYYVDNEPVATQTYHYGDAIVAPEYTAPTGYEFSGWTVPETMPAEDINVYGTLTQLEYTVTYTINGEFYAEQTYHYGDPIVVPEYNAPDGWTFTGWTVPETMPAENITVDATLSEVPVYTVTYTINGEVYTTQTYYAGDAIVVPEYTVPEGYTFSGWDVPETMPAENITVDAALTPNNYTITILYLRYSEALEDWVALQNPAYVTVPYGALYDVNDQIPAAIGEYVLVEVIGDVTGNVTGDITIEAHYAIPVVPTHTVTYTINGEEYAVQTYEEGAAIVAPEYEVPYGYTFSGWDVPETMGTEDITVDATLTPNNYTITILYLRYSEALEDWVALENPAYVTLPYGSLYDVNDQIPETIGEYALVEVIGDVTGNVTGDITIEAHYAIPAVPTHTVTYTINGEEYAVQTYEEGAAIVAPEFEVPYGYTFSGWDVPETMGTEDITVDATLTPNNYTITILYLRYSEALEDWVALENPVYITLPYGSLYDVNDQIPAAIGEYELVEVIGDVTGNVTGDITIEAHYAIPFEPVPPTVTGTRAELRARATEDAMKDLRFVYTVTFNDSYVVYNGTTYGPTTEYYKITKFWSVLAVGSKTVTVNGNSIYEMFDDSFTFTACLKGVKEANFSTAVTATPYLTYEMNGVAETVTGEPVVASVNDCLN